MSSTPSHQPFASAFRPDFEVVMERRGKVSWYPHTAQLPLLHRALSLEFRNALPGYLARVDRRGDAFHKHLLKQAALFFCNLFNAARTDGLHLAALTDEHLVTHLAVVQQVTVETPRGNQHQFRFYTGADFQPEIRLSGRRVVFTQHIIDRFTARVPNRLGEYLSMFLLAFFQSPIIALPVGGSASFVLPYHDSLLAFPFEVGAEEVVLLTCLTVSEINSLEEQIPTLAFNLHYGKNVQVPRIRHWLPYKQMTELLEKWKRKVPLPPPSPPPSRRLTWHWVAPRIREMEVKKGFGPGMSFAFLDQVPGPYTVHYPPSQPEPRVDERQVHKDSLAHIDWDDIFDERDYFILHFKKLKP